MINIIKKVSVLLIVLSSSAMLHGQMGFLNKKNILSVDGYLNAPLISGNFGETIYKKRNQELVEGKERLNFGLSLGYTRQLSRAFGMGFEGIIKQTKLISPTYFLTTNTVPGSNITYDSSSLKMQQIEALSFSYMIRMEFSNKLGVSPGGIVHSIAFGFSQSQLRNKGYTYSLNQFEPVSEYEEFWTENDNYYLTNDIPKIVSTTLSYALTYRHPFTKHLMGNIGVRYLFNYALEPSARIFNGSNPHPFDHQTLFFDLQRENLLTINFSAGISVVF